MKRTDSNDGERRHPVILTFTGCYLPGYKGGGPIRTIANMVAVLKDEFDFRIVTSDHDLGDRTAYPGIQVNTWEKVAGAQVLYLSLARCGGGGSPGKPCVAIFSAMD
jgi:hypothetical protein